MAALAGSKPRGFHLGPSELFRLDGRTLHHQDICRRPPQRHSACPAGRRSAHSRSRGLQPQLARRNRHRHSARRARRRFAHGPRPSLARHGLRAHCLQHPFHHRHHRRHGGPWLRHALLRSRRHPRPRLRPHRLASIPSSEPSSAGSAPPRPAPTPRPTCSSAACSA